jgi:hypothetical protein
MSDVPPETAPETGSDTGDDAVIGRAFRWSGGVIAVVAAAVVLVLVLRPEPDRPPEVIERDPIDAPPVLVQDAPDMPVVRFTDVTRAAGIAFVHENGAAGEKLLPETMGGGCAFLDYDADGDDDLLLVNSRPWALPPGATPAPTSALYRNDGTGRFEDVTAGSGLDVSLYGMGVAVGDHDGDGRVDVYLTTLGRNRLFRNDGGTFRDVTDAAGVGGPADAWSTSAGFFDYDRDGDLDLFVCRYVVWSREIDLALAFTLNGTDRAYGPPKQYRGTHSTLYRNEGDGTFTDVSAEAGIEVTNAATGEPKGKALAVTFADVDGDGWLDVFVANDTVDNFLFRNRGDGTFEEVGIAAGVAVDAMGSATGAMGADLADVANDGRLALGIGNFANESTSLYVQQGDPWLWADMASAEGIGSPSRLNLSFGLLFLDYDLDGRLDMLQANGHLEDEINAIQPSQHYHQPAQLFWNAGSAARSSFALVPPETLGDLPAPIVGRGAAYADVDADGDLDVLLTQVGGPPVLLRNEQDLGHHRVSIRLVGPPGNPDAIGAWVELTSGGVTQRRQVMPTRSYLSQVTPVVTFGLGPATTIDRVRVVWPDGVVQEDVTVPVDTLSVISR